MVDLKVTTNTGAESELENAAVSEFRESLRGELLCQEDDGYEGARKVWNAMIEKRPAMIARCAGVSDIINSVNFARTHNLLVAIQGGGHNVAGKSMSEGGLTIDLSPMKSIHVDPAKRIARAEPGLKLGEFDLETQAFGLATTLGINTDTGIAGLTLGGGYGWLMGKYGLACDNLLSVDVVTADGQFLTASASENEDLFWGMRGAGGNLGVVTSFEYQLHEVGPVLAGMIIHPLSQGKEVLQFYQEYTSAAPDELTTMAALLTTPDGDPAVAIAVCYCGPHDEGEKVLKPLRMHGSPVADLIGPMPYVELQKMLDPAFPNDHRIYWKTSLMRELGDAGIETMAAHAAKMPNQMAVAVLQRLGGVASRVGATETAFPHRYPHYDFIPVSIWLDPADDSRNIQWVREYWDAMQPYLERDAYVNDMGEEGEERVRDAYGANYDRLVSLKKRYDPTNLFSLNQNIKPGA